VHSTRATIRPASPHDADRLQEVHLESWRTGYRGLVPDEVLDERIGKRDADWYREMIEEPGTPRAGTWVAELDGEVVGFAHVREATDEDLDASHAEIPLFYFVREAWGTGAARPLLDAVLDDARVLDFRSAVLWVFRDNPRARRFYESAGFAEDGEEKWKEYGGKELAIVRYRLPL
jgi:RimJ/RimL family protein N-acetyltransferase